MTNSFNSACDQTAGTLASGIGKVVLLIGLLSLVGIPARAQESLPEFSVDVVSTRGSVENGAEDGLSLVDVYARIDYAKLSFITTPNGFSASYEVSLAAIEVNESIRLRNLVQSKIWDGNIVVPTYAQTQSDEFSDLTTQSLELSPGRYVFEFELSDKNSNQVFVQTLPVTVRRFDVPFSVSDLTLLESYDAETFSIVPRVGETVSTSDAGFQLFYEVYNDRQREVRVLREVFRTVGDGGAPVAPAWMGADPGNPNVVGAIFSETETAILAEGTSQHVVTVPLDDIKAGDYVVRVTFVGENEAVLDSAEKTVTFHWSGLAAHIEDIEQAIQQLEYIAKKKDLDFIRDARNQVERVQRFETFWEKRDPTPNTKRNESMEEYYYRVTSANQHYGAVQDGWKTDRGFVLVRYGEPDQVERQPFSFDYEPYEVWIYERIGRRFIFVDKTGFGDYELLVPVWDERSRLY